MATCPDCGHENIDGVDQCEKCHQSLSSLTRPRPTTSVERIVMKDRIESLVPREPLIVGPDTKVSRVLEQFVARSVGLRSDCVEPRSGLVSSLNETSWTG